MLSPFGICFAFALPRMEQLWALPPSVRPKGESVAPLFCFGPSFTPSGFAPLGQLSPIGRKPQLVFPSLPPPGVRQRKTKGQRTSSPSGTTTTLLLSLLSVAPLGHLRGLYPRRGGVKQQRIKGATTFPSGCPLGEPKGGAIYSPLRFAQRALVAPLRGQRSCPRRGTTKGKVLP